MNSNLSNRTTTPTDFKICRGYLFVYCGAFLSVGETCGLPRATAGRPYIKRTENVKILCPFVFYFIKLSKRVEDNRERVADASEKHEDVEDRVEISLIRADLIEDYADRVENSAAEKQPEAFRAESLVHRTDIEDYRPTRANVADHTENLIFLEVDRIEGYREDRKSPYYRKRRPRGKSIDTDECAEKHRRIRACDKKIYGAVVEYLQHLFGSSAIKRVIYA